MKKESCLCVNEMQLAVSRLLLIFKQMGSLIMNYASQRSNSWLTTLSKLGRIQMMSGG